MIIAIDPGCSESGVVIYNPYFNRIEFAEHSVENNTVLDLFTQWKIDTVLIEKPVGYSNANTVSDTIFWTGRLFQKAASLFLNIQQFTRSRIVGYYINKKTKIFFPEITEMKSADTKIKHIMKQVKMKFELEGGVEFAQDSWQAFALLYYYLVEHDYRSSYYKKEIWKGN